MSARQVLVTGGTSGIGQAVARAILDAGGQATYLPCDVTIAADCERAVRATVDQLGGIHILFNNAGIIRRATVLDTTEEEWEAQDVVDLIVEVGTTGSDNYVVTHRLGIGGQDLRVGVRHGENDRILGHRLEHLRGDCVLD